MSVRIFRCCHLNGLSLTCSLCTLTTNTMAAELVGSVLLMLKPATGHDPEPVSSTSDSHNLLKIQLNVILPSSKRSPTPKFYMHFLYLRLS
jgi:hypothetical protein